MFLARKSRFLLDCSFNMPLTTGMTMNLEAVESTSEETGGQVHADAHAAFVLQKVQPALLGLMDGSVSTLAPLFAAAGSTAFTHQTRYAFLIGLAASVGAGVSMGLAEALSDDGTVTGRGEPISRGAITGLATILGGMLHTLPFLIQNVSVALHTAYVVVVFELIVIAYIRFHFMKTPLLKTVVQVIVGGLIVFGIGIYLGRIGAAG
jgi:VIT1/CCC1 family predicted Fe2+/Mn2+ transporter